jgi:hypothetical protein
MNPLEQALHEVCAFLEREGIAYALVGGYAVQYLGEPRTTHDIDLEIIVDEADKAQVFQKLLTAFRPRLPDALEFALQYRVLLLSASNGVPVDISLAPPGYGEIVAQRAWRIAITPDAPPIAVISPEDLIVHKLIAHRPVDLQDVQGVLKRQGEALDMDYIRATLAAFGEYVWEYDLLGAFEQLLRATHADG